MSTKEETVESAAYRLLLAYDRRPTAESCGWPLCTVNANDLKTVIEAVQAQAKVAPKPASVATVRVRVAVAVDHEGDWHAYGDMSTGDATARAEAREFLFAPSALYWFEADLAIPSEQTVEATVVEAE